MDLQSLLKQLKELGQLDVGCGPKHPIFPDVTIANDVESFFDQYHFLREDQSYVDFIEYYGGLRLERSEDNLILDIFGFTSASSNILQLEGSIVDEDGFLTFCDGTIRDSETNTLKNIRSLSYSFDTTQKRKRGIYSTNEHANYWYCSTFLEWLQIIIATIKRI